MIRPEERIPSRMGPFEITAVLGEGGMGVVYAGHDAANGRHVAVKTVQDVEEHLLSSLRREIHALSRLHHPGVVRVLATGMDGGRPWYAMELLDGATLAILRDALWSTVDHHANTRTSTPDADRTVLRPYSAEEYSSAPLVRGPVAGGDLRRVLSVMRRLLTTLAFVHGEGLVHRDLKPSNVFLLPGDRPVLVDFGLASRSAGTTGREVLELAIEVAGTPAYMAPEQVRGDFVDSRADLYAIGCILHELLTGVPPFLGNGSFIMAQHLNGTPEPPSRRAEGVPPALDELVLALLEKRPRDRIGHAEDVIEALDELGAEPEPPPPSRPRPYVYRPSLAGREAALAELGRAASAASKGEGGCVLIAGASGIGKTYLAMEAARATSSFQIVSGACAPVGTFHHGPGGQPLHPFARLFQVIADRCTSEGRAETDRLLGARGKILAAHEPLLARLPGQDAYPDPPPLHGAAARDRLLTAFAGTLAALAEHQPLLLLLDDLQWADEVSIRLLTQLGDDWFAGKRILVLGTYRVEETTPGITELLARPCTRQVALGRLDRTAVRSLACDMLAVDDLPETFVDFLASHSEGNAFFVAEYLRCASSEGLLPRRAHRRLDSTDSGVFVLPVAMRTLVGRRLDGLSPDARTLAAVGSVIGRELDPDVLRDTAGLDDAAAMEATSELIARQVLEPSDTGGLRFSHDKLCEIAYERLPETQRIALHRTVAAVLERRFAAVPRFHAILAHHFVAAGDDARSIEYLDKAGQHALSVAAYAEALDLHKKLIALDDRYGTPDPRRRAHWERRLAETSFNLGDLAGVETYSLSAMKRLGRPMPTTRGGRALDIAKLIAEQALHRLGVGVAAHPGAAEREDRLDVAVSAAIMGWKYFFIEDMVGVLAMALRSVNEIEGAAPQIPIASPYGWLGYGSGIARLHRLARFYFDQAYANAEASGDLAGKHFSSVMEVAYKLAFGYWDEIEKLGQDALAELNAAGDPTNAELHLTGLANMRFYIARYHESERMFDQIMMASRARRNIQHHAWGLYGKCMSLVARGEFTISMERIAEAAPMLEACGDNASLIICDGLRATVHCRRGEDAQARVAVDDTRRRLPKSGIGMYATILGWVGAAETALELWERAPGDATLHELARQTCAALRRYSLFVPIAAPAWLRLQGQLHALEGNPARARRAFARAVASARRLAMPYDEATALWLAARYLPTQRRGLDQAARMFTQLGCAWHARQLEILR